MCSYTTATQRLTVTKVRKFQGRLRPFFSLPVYVVAGGCGFHKSLILTTLHVHNYTSNELHRTGSFSTSRQCLGDQVI